MDTELQQACDAFAANNYDLARPIFLKKFAAGCSEVGLSLGWLLQQGLGGPRNIEQACQIYTAMLPSEDGAAEYYLGRLILEQKKNAQEAAPLLTVAAEKGNPSAAYWLYSIASEGSDTPNVKLQSCADYWLQFAAKNGHLYAKREILKQELHRSQGFLDFIRRFRSYRDVAKEIQILKQSSPDDLRVR
jgi:TPR repeat protein